MKILYVVHRYAPYPGGSEYYTQAMAEETLHRGHQVTVFAGQHQGPLNGVNVLNDARILQYPCDLIVVHGGDVNVQNFVLSNARNIPSPILYMLVLPSESPVCVQALYDCTYIGWSTPQDWNHIVKYGVQQKAVHIPHGIRLDISTCPVPNFKEHLGITGTMFLSCGGYWPNKAMRELSELFIQANIPDAKLVLTGYDNSHNLMPAASTNVIPLLIGQHDRSQVINAIASADCYLLHSYTEGFGLVLLESMVNRTPWVARNIAGATLMQNYGKVYNTDEELKSILSTFNVYEFNTNTAYDYAVTHHSIVNTVDGILQLI